MTSIIKLQPLSGAMDEGPLCYVLQVDEYRFLLDAGWDEDFSQEHIELLKAQIPSIDGVLLTYPDIYHLGALPHLVGKCGLNCPIYATIPVYKMGQMFMYDLYQSRHNTEEFDVFTLDDVDAAFDKIVQLKFSQTVNLRGKGQGLQITPLPAGHMIGGTLWKIVKDGEEEIVYAVDYNHKKERHLNGCVLETISRPSILITDTYNSLYTQARRKQRDEQLMTNILLTMRNSGNVLVAVDAAGRVLELAHLLDQLWRTPDSGLMAYNLALLNNVSYNVVEFAKSQVEWMSDKIMRSFEDNRNNPFQFKHMQLCHSLAELAKVPEPKVVLASTPDLQGGFSRELFINWCSNPRNSIILTNRTSPGTLARWLIDNPQEKSLKLKVRKRVRLEGAELEEHLKKEQEREAAIKILQAEEAKKEKEMESSDESDEEMETDSVPFQQAGKAKHDLMSKGEGKSRTGFFKHAKKSYPMFPCEEVRLKWDDYGELIKPEDFMFMEVGVAEEEKQEPVVQEVEHVKDITEVPTKCIEGEQEVAINATVSFIDFEGRSDGESVKKILAQIRPRQLILVHGSEDATQTLAQHCLATGIVQGKVYTPKLLETIDATTESHIYQVKLREALVSSLDFCKAKEAELAWINTIVDMTQLRADTSYMYEPEEGEVTEEDGKGKKKLKAIGNSKQTGGDLLPTLEPIPANLQLSHQAVFINEPKLSDFKQVLVKHGVQAEFVAGSLICNGAIAVKRSEAGKIQLEGTIGEDYYLVRNLLYEQYAII